MSNEMEEVEPSLFEDVVKSVQRHSAYGAWVDSNHIGMECGFDRREAGRKVRSHLKNLVEMGLVEEQRELNKPIIYRWKEWEKAQ